MVRVGNGKYGEPGLGPGKRLGEDERVHATCSFALQVNFLIFIRVICIVVSKLKANLMCKTDIKCR
jgi:hypothetical protein